MADNETTGGDQAAAPVRKATGARRTMAPAARRPGGADEFAGLAELDAAALERLDAAVRKERTRRARHPEPPSFGLSEGERVELEQHGETNSPWTGERIEGDGRPRS